MSEEDDFDPGVGLNEDDAAAGSKKAVRGALQVLDANDDSVLSLEAR